MNESRYTRALLIVLLSILPVMSQAQSDIVLDGSYADWNTDSPYGDGGDFYAPMYEAGDTDKTHLSNFYFRYDNSDPANPIGYVLVLTIDEHTADQVEEDAWIKIYSISNKVLVDGTHDNFRWIFDDDERLIGYEASFDLIRNVVVYFDVEVHVNVDGGETSSTGKKASSLISLLIGDDLTDPIQLIDTLAGSPGDDSGTGDNAGSSDFTICDGRETGTRISVSASGSMITRSVPCN